MLYLFLHDFLMLCMFLINCLVGNVFSLFISIMLFCINCEFPIGFHMMSR